MTESPRSIWLPDTLSTAAKDMLNEFFYTIGQKMAKAQEKYNYNDDWARADWGDECRSELRKHIAKGDPVDAAIYCAFLQHHNEPTAKPMPTSAVRVGETVTWTELREALRLDGYRIPVSTHAMKHTEAFVRKVVDEYIAACSAVDNTPPSEVVESDPINPEETPPLKPCPFCGSANIDVRGWASEMTAGPACDECGASAGGATDSIANNIAAWNARVSVDPTNYAHLGTIAYALEVIDREIIETAPGGGMEHAANNACLRYVRGQIAGGETATASEPAPASVELECSDPAPIDSLMGTFEHMKAVRARLERSGAFSPELSRAQKAASLTELQIELKKARETIDILQARVPDPKYMVKQSTNSRTFEMLEELAGYFQDGSAETVSISPDDATRTWHVSLGLVNRRQIAYHETFGGAIRAAAAVRGISITERVFGVPATPKVQSMVLDYQKPRQRHSCELDMLSACPACEADKESLADEVAAPGIDPTAAATVCMVTEVGEPYAHGHFVEAQLQVPQGKTIASGTRLYEFEILGWIAKSDCIFRKEFSATTPIIYDTEGEHNNRVPLFVRVAP